MCIRDRREWGLTFTEVGVLVIPPRTLKHRKAKGERLTTEETERFLRVIRVLEWGERVFGDRDKLFRWLRSADELMDNRTSMSLLATESGAKRVEGQMCIRDRYWEPAKYVAKLRTLKTNDAPLLLKIKMEPAGHGGASGRYDRMKDQAFEYAWLLTQVGITK